MLKLKRGIDYPDAELYLEHLRERGFIYFDKQLANNVLFYYVTKLETLSSKAKRVLYVDSGRKYLKLDKDKIMAYLISFENVDSSRYITSKGNYSLDLDKKINLMSSGKAPELMETLVAVDSLKSTNGTMTNIVNKLTPSGLKHTDGCSLYELTFFVEQKTNLRFNYSNSALQSIPKIYNQCVKVPVGMCMAIADIDQADWSIMFNTFLKTKDNMKFIQDTEDRYKGAELWRHSVFNRVFNEEQFKEDRHDLKGLILGTGYGKHSGITEKHKSIVDEYNTLFDKSPVYGEYRRRLIEYRDLGIPGTISSYFGHESTLPVVEKNINGSYRGENPLTIGLNAPIQTTTSEIIIMQANSIIKQFRELGYSKDDVSILYNRHDELIFMISEKAMKDSWIFCNNSIIQVDDWLPINMNFTFRNTYTEPNEYFQSLYENSILLNKEKIQYVEPTPPIDTYMPISEIKYYSFASIDSGDGFIISCIFNNKTRCAHVMKTSYTSVNDKPSKENILLSELDKVSDTLSNNGVDILFMNTYDKVAGSSIIGAISVTFTSQYRADIDRAHSICASVLRSMEIKENKNYLSEDNKLIADRNKGFFTNIKPIIWEKE